MTALGDGGPAVPREVPRLVGVVAALLIILSWVNVASTTVGGGLRGPRWWAVPLIGASLAATALLASRMLQGRGAERPAIAVVGLTALTLSSGLALEQAGLMAPPPVDGRTWATHLDVPCATAAAVAVLRRPLLPGLAVMAGTVIGMAVLRSQPPFSGAALQLALADATFLVALAAAVYGGFVAVTEVTTSVGRARAVADEAVEEASDADAAEADRARWESLIHDHVLSALRAVDHVDASSDRATISAAARSALARLAIDPRGADTGADYLRRRLAEAARAVHPGVVVRLEVSGADLLPGAVADALVDATSELVRNAALHAGPTATTVVTGVIGGRATHVVVQDDGVGFDPARVGGERLGLRLSVARRLVAVRGAVHVSARAGRGSRIALSWPGGTGADADADADG